MQQLVILNYTTSTIDIYNIENLVDVNDDYLSSLGYNPDECSWMWSDELKVKFHSKTLK